MSLSKKRTLDLAKFGIPATVELDTEWRVASLQFPNPAGWDMVLHLAATVGGKDIEQLSIRVDNASSPTIGEVCDAKLPKPATVATVGEVLKLATQTIYQTMAALLPDFQDGTVDDTAIVPTNVKKP